MSKNNHSENILIVEGEADRSFLEQLCNKLQLSTEVITIATPKNLLDDGYNTKAGAFQAFTDRLRLLQADSALKKLAIVVDADHQKDGQGFKKTFDDISKILADFDFYHAVDEPQHGFIFKYSGEGVHSVGVWIMPNNAADGAIESWIGQCVDAEKCHLLPHAKHVVNTLPECTFSGNNQQKAEIATWLAWQKRPSIGLYAAVPFLNEQAAAYRQLKHWLEVVFEH